ncbi:hypothetical protein LHP98_01140 [Rhodobacter sp. Har01]|uniref:hypothetical protein n=1 Tax=Rhodobacter sp. Har01 TaxID=2883999 RepID=UPI001D062611|nr:hypothetical protein [Rhodobacter sp. Har01]MCB6176732.1 hypothetical protein [Rhodobacter sp. Har01]
MDPSATRVQMSNRRIGVLGGDPQLSVAAALRRAGLDVADAEPPPKQMNDAQLARFGFAAASVRAGRLGDVRHLLQLVQEATGERQPRHWVWKDAAGRFFDGLRPGLDPASADRAEVESCRRAHLAALGGLLAQLDDLVLPLCRTAGVFDAADGTVYPGPVPGARLPRGCKLVLAAHSLADLEADFQALHACLTALRPGLRLHLVVLAPPQPAPEALAARITLQTLAADWAGRLHGVRHDTILDALIGRLAAPDADPRLGPLLARLFAAEDVAAALVDAAAPPRTDPTEAPATTPADRRARREARAKRKKRAGPDARVVCEDELLEAFS